MKAVTQLMIILGSRIWIREDDDDESWNSEELRTPHSTDDEEDHMELAEIFPQFNPQASFGHVVLEIGMEFTTVEAFKQGVRDYTINLGREIKWVKNDKLRARAKCKNDECQWVIYCGYSNARHRYQIKTFISEHTCSRTFRNSQANQTWAIGKLVKKLRKHPTMKHREVYDYFKRKYGVILEGTKIYRATVKAREIIEGSENGQFRKLWDYCGELLRCNPGSTAKMDTYPQPKGPPVFHRLYICLEGCKSGFKVGCRPLIGLDGAFLKGYYGGQLLSAVGQDANNHIWPIAYAVVDVENKDNWKWFLGLLHEDLGDYRQHNWNFISNMQKGLIPALQEVMPGSQHRFCVWHLWQNFTKQWKDKELRGLLWECARSTTTAEFNLKMNEVKRINDKAWKYLDKWPRESWTKSAFSDWAKVKNICNNNCEVFNSKIIAARAKPIITMLEEVRCYIMTTITTNKLKMERHLTKILAPVQQGRLEKQKKASNIWTPLWAGDEDQNKFEVHSYHSKVAVNLGTQECTCRFWQLTGLPCAHEVSAIAWKNDKPEDYCHGWLTMSSITTTYVHHINPLQGEQYWTQVDQIPPLPPPMKKGPGRPKKNRRKDGREETVSGSKLKRKLGDFTCTACGGKKHNKQTFPTQTAPAPTGIGPTETAPAPTAIGSSTFQQNPSQCGPEEIKLSLSQPPPVIQSPSKTNTMLLRKKQPLRRGPPQARQKSPPPAASVQPQDDSSKAHQFMPTPGLKKTLP